MSWGGAAFLVAYGARALRNAARGGEAMQAGPQGGATRRATLVTCLALTWLNPHVCLDTVVLLGSVGRAQPAPALFAAGAVAASFVFFFALGYGARALAPLFARPAAWRMLDALVGATMWAIAAALVVP